MKNLFITLSFFVLTLSSYGTHYLSSDISYANISGNTYGITIRIYNNTFNTTADRCEILVYFGNGGDSAIVPRINGTSSLCPSTHDGVMLTQYPNIKESIYYTTYTYPSAGTYIVSFTEVNRVSGICNIPNSLNTGIYEKAEIVIDPFLGDNNAPQFTTIPLNYYSVGVSGYYNPSVIDTEGDSLYYQLIPAMVDSQSIVGFSFPPASNSFSIDSLTGMVTWDKPSMICTYSYDIKITEWRKVGGIRYYIGSTMQDIYNYVSIATGIDNSINNEIFTIYPNPTQSQITLEVDLSKTKDVLIEIKNILGQTVKTIDNKAFINGNNKIEIDVSQYPGGLYLLQLQGENKLWSKNFMKE